MYEGLFGIKEFKCIIDGLKVLGNDETVLEVEGCVIRIRGKGSWHDITEIS